MIDLLLILAACSAGLTAFVVTPLSWIHLSPWVDIRYVVPRCFAAFFVSLSFFTWLFEIIEGGP